jgi:indole-3-glycerol phosphate synthase
MTILEEIFTHKRQEVARLKHERPLAEVQAAVEEAPPAMDFPAALRAASRPPALIAEIKKASPSSGELAPDLDPLEQAAIYQENGAAAVSVLTEERYFKGSLEILHQLSAVDNRLPLLRKDFIFDPYQVYEARAAGADAVLLITAMLEPKQLQNLQTLAERLGMAALVEVHTQGELNTALAYHPSLVGINNRDLKSFQVRLGTTLELRPQIPENVVVVAESGIQTSRDVEFLAEAGVDAILVGEALVTAPDVGMAVRDLSGMQIGDNSFNSRGFKPPAVNGKSSANNGIDPNA